jgi:T5SS/PEP-CTERM-associated repeat protein
MRTRMATRALVALLLVIAPALPAAAVITIVPDGSVTSVLTLVDHIATFDQDRADAEDIADSDLTVTSQIVPVTGLRMTSTSSLRTKATIDGDDSAQIEVSGSFHIVHDFPDGPLEFANSRAFAATSIQFCTSEPVSFSVSGSADSEGTPETYNQPGLSRTLSYNPVFISAGGGSASFEAGIGAETVAILGMGTPDAASFRPSASGADSGELEAGCHGVGARMEARLIAPQRDFVDGPILNIPETRGSFRVRIVLSSTGPDEAESDTFEWVGPAQGAFAAEGNWEGENGAPGVPGFVSFEDADTAIVDSASDVTIDLGASGLSRALDPRGPLPERRTGRLQVLRSGRLRPVGGTLLLDSLDPELDERSLEVAGGATLLLDAGGVQARHVTLGAVGDGTLEVVGPGGFFATQGRFGIGGEGNGILRVRNGATITSAESVLGEAGGGGFALVQEEGSLWQTGNFAVGFADAAAVNIEAGARVESDNAFVDCRIGDCTGLADLERATVDVIGKSAGGTPSRFVVADELQIGPLGKVSVEGGAALQSDVGIIRIGTGSGAADCLAGRACLDVVDGSVGVGAIDVGFTGPGKMQIGPLGRATVLAALFVGANLLVPGELVVTGPSAEPQLVAPIGVGVSVGSHGEVLLQGGARVTTSVAGAGGAGPGAFGRIEIRDDSVLRVADSIIAALTIGSEASDDVFGPTGELELANGRVELEDADLDIENTGRVFGSGVVDGFGVSFVNNDGEIGCGITINAAYVQGPNGVALCPQAILSPVTLPQLNPLAASRFARAVRARPAPPPLPVPGPLVVNGDATLAGTLVLQFVNGFAPRQGNSFDLIDVAGTVTGAFANVEVRGLVPDSDFAEDFVDGKLTLTALSDTEALPTVSVAAKPSVFESKFKKGLKVKFKRKGDTSEPLQVAYTVGGTARNGFDYERLSGVIEIPARKKSAKLVIHPVPDGVAEGPETLSLEVQPGENYTQSLFARVEIVLENGAPRKRR